jgi:farnesyl-diphosphate farnesyltransferase
MSGMVADTPPGNVEAWSGKTRTDENFPVGSRLIARRVRTHMHAYYNFARNADDIADSPVLSPQEKIARLDVMEEVLLGRRLNGSPSASALRKSLDDTGVRAVHATDLLIAFRQDATKTRYETFDELYNYCRYSAVPVGRYVIDLHGESQTAYGASDALCISLQILNHLQDCGDDMRTLDRCYIPLTLMRHFRVSARDLLAPAESPALRRAFITLLDRIDRLNLAAEELPWRVRDRRLRVETAFICRLAIRLAERLGRGDPLASRVALTKSDFAFSLLRAVGTLVWH